MARTPSLERSQSLHLKLKEDVLARVDVALYSELERRVPHGAYQKFFTSLVLKFFSDKKLDLAPFTGKLPGIDVVQGPEHAIEQLRYLLIRSEK